MNWIVWALLSAFFAALTALLAKEGVAHIDSNLATAVRTTVVVLFAWAIAIGFGAHGGLQHIERRSWVFLTLSGLATGLSWICYFRALKVGEVSQVAPVDKLSVAIAILLAVVFLGERIGWQQGLGAALIVIGVTLLAVKW